MPSIVRVFIIGLQGIQLLGCTPAAQGHQRTPASSSAQASTSPSPRSSAQVEIEQPIPADLSEQVERSCAIGRELYELDKVAVIGTDVLVAKVPDFQDRGLAGYVPVRERDESGEWTGAFVVSFFTQDHPPRIAYEIRIEPNSGSSFQAFAPPNAASADFTELVRARQLAIAAMPASNQPINPVLLPAQVIGESGVLVYLLAGTKQPDLAVFGQHFRVLVAPGGARVTSITPLTKAPLEIPTRGHDGKRVTALLVTQLVTEYPAETHVFTSLLLEMPVYVATSRGTWRVDRGRIGFLGELEPKDAK